MSSVSLDGVMVNTLARNAKDVGSITALGAIFPKLYATLSILPQMTMYLGLSSKFLKQLGRFFIALLALAGFLAQGGRWISTRLMAVISRRAKRR